MAAGNRKIELARSLRRQDVPAERRLWGALRNRALGDFKFRRQHPIDDYIVDFACVESLVIVEADGLSHLYNRREDLSRTRALQNLGWRVLRFWNTEIYEVVDPVKEAIYRECIRRQKLQSIPDDRVPPSP